VVRERRFLKRRVTEAKEKVAVERESSEGIRPLVSS